MAKKFGFDHPTPHNTLLFSGIDTQYLIIGKNYEQVIALKLYKNIPINLLILTFHFKGVNLRHSPLRRM